MYVMSGTHTFISSKISILFGSEISLKDFSFSQLIVGVKNLFDTEGNPGFVKALVILIDVLIERESGYLHLCRILSMWTVRWCNHILIYVEPLFYFSILQILQLLMLN